jgi:hypothetical protein
MNHTHLLISQKNVLFGMSSYIDIEWVMYVSRTKISRVIRSEKPFIKIGNVPEDLNSKLSFSRKV